MLANLASSSSRSLLEPLAPRRPGLLVASALVASISLAGHATGQCDTDTFTSLEYKMPPWPEAAGTVWGDMDADNLVNHRDYAAFIKLAASCANGPDPFSPAELIKTTNTFTDLLMNPPTPPGSVTINGSMAGPYGQQEEEEYCSRGDAFEGTAIVFNENLGRVPNKAEMSSFRLSNDPNKPQETPCDEPEKEPTDGTPDTDGDDGIQCMSDMLPDLQETIGGVCSTPPTGPFIPECHSDGTDCGTIIICASETVSDCDPDSQTGEIPAPPPETGFPDACAMEATEEDMNGCLSDRPAELPDNLEDLLFPDDDDGDGEKKPIFYSSDKGPSNTSNQTPDDPANSDQNEEGTGDDEDDGGACDEGNEEGKEGNGRTTPVPVDLITGEKREMNQIDMRLKLPGPDFVIRRNYLGTLIDNLLGPGWRLDSFMWASTTATTDGGFTGGTSASRPYAPRQISLFGLAQNGQRYSFQNYAQYPVAGANTYESNFGGQGYMTLNSVTGAGNYNFSNIMYYAPGSGTVEFEQVTGINEAITVLFVPKYQRDNAGNVREYKYIELPFDNSNTLTKTRLETINFYTGVGPNETPDPAMNSNHVAVAKVRFRWLLVLGDSGIQAGIDGVSPIQGQLAAAIAYRPDPNNAGQWIETQQVDYTYKWDWDNFSADVSQNNGSLIQVRRHVRVDDGWTGSYDIDGDGRNEETTPGFPHTTRVTQYRYHTDGDVFDSTQQSPIDDRYLLDAELSNGAGPLKMVINNDAIEAMARWWGSTAGLDDPSLAQRRAALVSMTLDDDEIAYQENFSTPITMTDMASKILGYTMSVAGSESEVSEQFLQGPGCGCGGNMTAYRRLEYEYKDLVLTASRWRSTKVSEHVDFGDGNGEVLYREIYYDLYSPTQSPLFLQRKFDTVIEYDPDTGNAVQTWVTEFLRDDRIQETPTLINRQGNLLATIPPGSMDGSTYLPMNTSTSTPPSCVRRTGELARTYDYDDLGRVTAVKVSDIGSVSIPANINDTVTGTILRRDFYENTTYPYLLTKREWYTTATATSNATRTVRFEHTLSGDRLVKLERFVESPESSEGGPSAGQGNSQSVTLHGETGVFFRSAYGFDVNGNMIAMRSADGLITKIDRDANTGMATSVTRNFAGTINLDSSTAFESGISNSLAAVEVSYDVDEVGRLKEIHIPITMGSTLSNVTESVRRIARGYRTVSGLPMLPYPEQVSLASMAYPYVMSLPNYLGSGEFDGPATVTWMYRDGRPLVIAQFVLGTNGISSDPYASSVDLFDDLLGNQDSELVGLTAYDYDRSGNRTHKWIWREIASNSYGETTYEYDAIGRLVWTQDPTGERVGIASYDAMNRPLAFMRATEATSSSPIITRTVVRDFDTYSSGGLTRNVDGGNGWLIKTIDHVSSTSSDERITEYDRDGRGRVVRVLNPQAPHQSIGYNNLNEPIAAAEYGVAASSVPTDPTSSSQASNRSSFVTLDYNQRGHVFRVQSAFDPDSSSPAAFTESRTWYDAMGRVIAEAATGSPVTKLAYDILGRQAAAYVTDIGSDPLSMSFAEASDAVGDTVFEQYEQAYSAVGLPLLSTSRIRLDTAGSHAGALTSSSAVATFEGVYFDDIGRPLASVSFGTNDSSGAFVSGTSAPTWPPASAPISAGTGDDIVTEIKYDNRGRVDQVLDPEGIRTKIWYDDSGRRVAVTENFTDTSGAGATEFAGYDTGYGYPLFNSLFQNDDERTTGFVYDGASRVTHRVAYLPSNAYQVTKYEYGVQDSIDQHGSLTETALPDSLITSNALLARVIYPDEATGFPVPTDGTAQRFFAYNRQGEVIGVQDQMNNVHTFTRDVLGRVTHDIIENFGSSTDTAIDRIETDYDEHGRIESVRSANGLITVNAVKFVYTQAGLVKEFIQEANGAVNVFTSPRVIYDYEDGETGEGLSGRVKAVTYPTIDTGLASTISMYYGSANSVDDRISRLLGLDSPGLTGSSNEIVRYDFLGLATPIKTMYPIPGVSLDRTLAGDGSSTAGQFPGFDTFGRIARHTWADDNIAQGTGGSPTIPPIIDRILGYSKSSQLTHDLDGRPAASGASRDRVYEHDNLNRLVKSNLGATASLDPANLTAGPFSEEWDLDTLGNWSSYGEDTDGDGSLNLFDSEYNGVNELNVRYTGADRRYEFVYDDNGNMTEIGRRMGATAPYAYANHSEYTFDGWNRLVSAKRPDSSGLTMLPVGEYEYNGLGHRVRKRADTSTTAANGLDEQRTYFYTPGWQMIEECIDIDDDLSNGNTGNDGTINRIAQQFWGMRYIDDAVARRTDNDADGDFTDAGDGLFFYLTDRQFSVNALIRADGDVVERIEYSPYGLARRVESPSTGDLGQQLHGYNEDVDGDGLVDASDAAEILSILPSNFLSGGSVPMSDAAYESRLDLNQDGKIDFFYDYAPAYLNDGLSSPPTGWISDPQMPLQDGTPGPDNPIGYTGHIFDPETGLYLARFRHYAPEFGRWAQRDPVHYIDGMNFYQYTISSPLFYKDPFGLAPQDSWKGLPEGLVKDRHFRQFVEDSKIGMSFRNGFTYNRAQLFDLAKDYIDYGGKISVEDRAKILRSVKGNIRKGKGGLLMVTLGMYLMFDDIAKAASNENSPCRQLVKYLDEAAVNETPLSIGHLDSLGEKCKWELVLIAANTYNSEGGSVVHAAFDKFMETIRKAADTHNQKCSKQKKDQKE